MARQAAASAAPTKRQYDMESSSGKIRQSSYNHAASPRQDPPAGGREKAVAAPVRAARRADQGRPAYPRRAPADRAGAHAGGPSEQDGGARGGRGAARRGDRPCRVSALSPVHRPAPDPAPHGERAARADGGPARLPRPDPGRASQDLPGDREPRSERGARCDAAPSHPLARPLPTPGGATQSSVVVRILLTHSPEALALYYGERALKGLQNLGEVK